MRGKYYFLLKKFVREKHCSSLKNKKVWQTSSSEKGCSSVNFGRNLNPQLKLGKSLRSEDDLCSVELLVDGKSLT